MQRQEAMTVSMANGVTIYIYPDDTGDHDCPLDCLKQDDDVRVLIWDRRSTLGDYNQFKNEDPNDILGWAFWHGYECFPLWKYEHGGVDYSVSQGGNPYHDRWDSSLTGWILVEIGVFDSLERKTEHRHSNLEVAESWAKALTTWCNGWYYGYEIEDKHGEHLDSCWGFDDLDYCKSEAIESAKHHIDKISTKEARKLERARPDMYPS